MKSRLNQIRDWHALAVEAKYNPASLADLASMSPRQLRRFFVLHKGMTPRQWLKELQMLKALQLRAEGYRTKEAADMLHYRQPSHFCKDFRRFHGFAWSSAPITSAKKKL